MKKIVLFFTCFAFLSVSRADRVTAYGYWIHDNPEAPYEGLVEMRVTEQDNVHIEYLHRGTRAIASGKLFGRHFTAYGKITRGKCEGQEITVKGIWCGDYYQLDTKGSVCLEEKYYPVRKGTQPHDNRSPNVNY